MSLTGQEPPLDPVSRTSLVRWHWTLGVSFLLVFVAGVAGAIVATSAIESRSYEDFADSHQGAYGVKPLKGKY